MFTRAKLIIMHSTAAQITKRAESGRKAPANDPNRCQDTRWCSARQQPTAFSVSFSSQTCPRGLQEFSLTRRSHVRLKESLRPAVRYHFWMRQGRTTMRACREPKKKKSRTLCLIDDCMRQPEEGLPLSLSFLAHLISCQTDR